LIVEISKHGTSLKRNHKSFVIKNNDEVIDIPAEKVDAFIISANCNITTQFIKLCLERQIQMVLTEYSGQPFARLWSSAYGRTTSIRRAQYLNQESTLSKKIAKNLVIAKLKKQKSLLLELRNNREEHIVELELAIDSINQTIQKIKDLNENVLEKDSLRGLEGSAGRVYFSAISAILPQKWKFEKRTQHPAKDGFNAALNYIYGMAYSSIEKIIILSGLDPNAGFFHSDSYGKPTLAFDIIEMFRPELDKTILALFTKRQVSDAWFDTEIIDGVYFSKIGRMRILEEYRGKNQKKIEADTWKFCKDLSENLVVE